MIKITPPSLLSLKIAVAGVIDEVRYRLTKSKRQQRRVMDNFATVDYIISHRCSISRYGDGELNLVMAGKYGTAFQSGFQRYDAALAKRLEEILGYRHKAVNHLVCLPGCAFGIGTGYLRRPARRFWQGFVARNIDRFLEMTAPGELYGETNISRFYLSHRDKSRCGEFVARMKQIWAGRDVVIVEGNLTRLGYGNDLFAGARTVRRILCPNDSAFSKYDEILQTTLAHTTPGTLIILALGMTATVLAYDLAAAGRQALDIGHIDIEYEWMRMGATEKVPVSGKFTNEAVGSKNVKPLPSDGFLQQVITDISR